MTTTITHISNDKWLIRVERERGENSASGQVILVQDTAPTAEGAPHLSLAGARAWLALAQARQSHNDIDSAIASARAGIEELGRHNYSPLRVKEDTSLRINMADDLIERGHLPEAARMLIDSLETRIKLYVRLYSNSIAE
jgi:hypothetical protein